MWAFEDSGQPVLEQSKTEDDLSPKMPRDIRQTKRLSTWGPLKQGQTSAALWKILLL